MNKAKSQRIGNSIQRQLVIGEFVPKTRDKILQDISWKVRVDVRNHISRNTYSKVWKIVQHAVGRNVQLNFCENGVLNP